LLKKYSWRQPNSMIKVTRLNGKCFYINAELIEMVEATPDTVITLVTKEKFIVKDAVEDIVCKIIDYKQRVHHSKLDMPGLEDTGA